jgi:hypothetical protein
MKEQMYGRITYNTKEDLRKLANVSSYGRYSSSNYGVHTLKVSLPEIEIYFSYETPVAFWLAGEGLTVCENEWGVTTGKHLNWISTDHTRRIPSDLFAEKLAAALTAKGLAL